MWSSFLFYAFLTLLAVCNAQTEPASSPVSSSAQEVESSSASASAPFFVPVEATHVSVVEVFLDSDLDGSLYYYTLDGSTPVVESSPHVAMGVPIIIDSIGATTVNAISVHDGYSDSVMSTYVYQILDRCVNMDNYLWVMLLRGLFLCSIHVIFYI